MLIIFGYDNKNKRKVYNREHNHWKDNYNNDISLNSSHSIPEGQTGVYLVEAKKHKGIKNIMPYDTLEVRVRRD
jgi:hypothetical protein